MDGLKFLQEQERMINSWAKTQEYFTKRGRYASLTNEEAIKAVEKWSAEHPQKTNLTDFMEKHPKALLKKDGLPVACCKDLGYKHCSCVIGCHDCWNKPLEEET